MNFSFRAVFWDMDGTLIDSEPLWSVATYELSELLGRRITPEVREKTVGGSFRNTLNVLATWAGIDPTTLDEHEYRQWMYRRMGELLTDLTPNPGVRELLTALYPLPMLVTTNTERELADRCIDAVGREFFFSSITGDEVAHSKPAPDMYLEAARQVGAVPGECVVFEDSFAGMTAAHAAGCVVIGLAHETPEGVTSLAALHGSLSLDGVTTDHVETWFKALR
ncbi:HAD family hydrolase [Corynebacterium uterequi]|nr:HAD family phosphatase [Corynebacterium uterequi]